MCHVFGQDNTPVVPLSMTNCPFQCHWTKKTFSCFENTCVHTVHKAIFHATWCTINFLNSSCRLSQSPLQLYKFPVRAWSPLPHSSFEHCGHFYCSELSLWASLHKLLKNTCKYVDFVVFTDRYCKSQLSYNVVKRH